MAGVPVPNPCWAGVGVSVEAAVFVFAFVFASVFASVFAFVFVFAFLSSRPHPTHTMADFFPIMTMDPTMSFGLWNELRDDGRASPNGMVRRTGSSRPRGSTAGGAVAGAVAVADCGKDVDMVDGWMDGFSSVIR